MKQALRLGVLVFLLGYFVLFVWYAAALFLFPYDWNLGEADGTMYAWRILNGQPVYKDNNTFPMLGLCYPPLYFWLISRFILFLGRSLYIGRMISLLSSLATGFIIFLWVRKKTGRSYPAIIACLLFFAPGFLAKWMAIAKLDNLALFLSFLGVYCIWLSHHRRLDSKFYLGTFFLLASALTKQTYLIWCVPTAVYLFLDSRKKGAVFLISSILVLGPACIYLQRTSSGWFFINVVRDNLAMRPYNVVYMVHFLLKNDVLIGGILICGAGYSVYTLVRKRDVYLPLVFFFALSLQLVGGKGLGGNYNVLPVLAFGCLFVGVAWGEFSLVFADRSQEKRIEARFLFFILLQLLVLFPYNLTRYAPQAHDFRNLRVIHDAVSRTPGPVFIESLSSILNLTGKDGYFVEASMVNELDFSGLWKGDDLLSAIRSKKFALMVVIQDSALPSRVLKEIVANYRTGALLDVGSQDGRRKVYLLRPVAQ